MARKLIKKEIGPTRHNMIYKIPEIIEKEFTEDCLKIAKWKSCEILDCAQSIRRQKIDTKPEELLQVIRNKSLKHYSFILRKNLFSQDDNQKYKLNYWEYCASGFQNQIEHFLWLEIEEEAGYKLVEKYNLKKNDEQ